MSNFTQILFGSLLDSPAVVEITSELGGKAVSLIKEHFTFTSYEITNAYQQSYGYALVAIRLGVTSPEPSLLQKIRHSKITREFAEQVKQQYWQPFVQQSDIDDLAEFRTQAAEKLHYFSKRTVQLGAIEEITEEDLAALISYQQRLAITDLLLEQMHTIEQVDERLSTFLRHQDLLGHAVLFFFRELLRQDQRLAATQTALQQTKLCIDVQNLQATIDDLKTQQQKYPLLSEPIEQQLLRKKQEAERQAEEAEQLRQEQEAKRQAEEAERLRKKQEAERQAEEAERLRKEQAIKERTKRQLSPFNPLDHLRLLWWILVMPQYLKAYKEVFGEEDVERVGKWLVSTLVWLPLWMPALALGLELLPITSGASAPDVYLWISVALGGVWLLTGWFGDVDEVSVIGVAVGVAVGVVVGLALGLVGLAVGLAVGVAVSILLLFGLIIAIGIIGIFVEESLETGTPSWFARFAFLLLVAAHLFLISYCFLGGWRLFI